jgi:hypothetical protein
MQTSTCKSAGLTLLAKIVTAILPALPVHDPLPHRGQVHKLHAALGGVSQHAVVDTGQLLTHAPSALAPPMDIAARTQVEDTGCAQCMYFLRLMRHPAKFAAAASMHTWKGTQLQWDVPLQSHDMHCIR